ncbi:MAG: hypothetical protein FJY80_08540, partial [Candidatus Aminicenantes bacterium]|nr:hypothetical protein [Candidatus Aminicenantes bacterium]
MKACGLARQTSRKIHPALLGAVVLVLGAFRPGVSTGSRTASDGDRLSEALFFDPPLEARPGFVYHAGEHFNVNTTWWDQAGPLIEYMSRCDDLLQQGLFLDKGYDDDYVASEVILERMRVSGGRITTSFEASLRGTEPGRPDAGPRPVRILILSGENNHDWKSSTPKLEAILEKSGRFHIEITEKPALLTDRSLEPYDVILSNWNIFGRAPSVTDWPDETRRAYLDFVRRGKGHVVVHAGSSSFPDWGEYQRLTLAGWKNGQTAHGPRHEFTVRIEDASHPVTAGMEPFRIFDELWNKPGVSDGAAVLASSYSAPDQEGTGRWEPAVLAGRFGAGRSVTILLGHDSASMDNPGFQALLRRGVEWAATGRVEAPAGSAADSWRWEKQDGASLALVGPKGPVWRFRYGP